MEGDKNNKNEKSFIDSYVVFARWLLIAGMLLDGASTYIFMSQHIPETSGMSPLPGIIPPMHELRNGGNNFYGDLSGMLYCAEIMLGCRILGRVTGPYLEAFTLTFAALTWASLAYSNIKVMLEILP